MVPAGPRANRWTALFSTVAAGASGVYPPGTSFQPVQPEPVALFRYRALSKPRANTRRVPFWAVAATAEGVYPPGTSRQPDQVPPAGRMFTQTPLSGPRAIRSSVSPTTVAPSAEPVTPPPGTTFQPVHVCP